MVTSYIPEMVKSPVEKQLFLLVSCFCQLIFTEVFPMTDIVGGMFLN